MFVYTFAFCRLELRMPTFAYDTTGYQSLYRFQCSIWWHLMCIFHLDLSSLRRMDRRKKKEWKKKERIRDINLLSFILYSFFRSFIFFPLFLFFSLPFILPPSIHSSFFHPNYIHSSFIHPFFNLQCVLSFDFFLWSEDSQFFFLCLKKRNIILSLYWTLCTRKGGEGNCAYSQVLLFHSSVT